MNKSGPETVASDNALVRRAALGEREAFADLFHRHSAATFRYAVHMLDGDEHLAQDVVQDAWIKAWMHLPGYRGESSFRTWMIKIIVREVYSNRRRRRPIPVNDEQLKAQLEAAADSDGDGPFAATELADALAAELLRLPWRQRAVWLLREFEDMPYSQIAKALDTNVTTVRGQLHRARRTLALRMEQWR
ncbi:sigma-70 family RNA polymerase sigma factor [soil metagenome]